jgi:L-lactate dehydrogenase complex protein LldE
MPCRVAVFVPCLVDLFMPRAAEAAFRLLRRLGLEPVYQAEQTCCGQPALNAGYRRRARKMAQHFIEVFEGDEAVVGLSGSCVYTVKSRYPDLFAGEPRWLQRAERLSARIYELSQYLVDVLGVTEVGAAFQSKVAYHSSCQLYRGLGVSAQPRALIEATAGAELMAMDRAESCCGFGGEFAVTYPELSTAMVSDKAAAFLASGAEVLVACEPGCLLNIGGYLSRHHPEKKVMHLAELLAGSQRD